jgi:hypothetical protein
MGVSRALQEGHHPAARVVDMVSAYSVLLMPLARLLLRTESIASSKVEGMQVDARALIRAEATQETGHSIGTNAAEILGNIDAMQLAIERASSLEGIRLEDLIDIHQALLKRAPSSQSAGRLRASQNWIGATITTLGVLTLFHLLPKKCGVYSRTFAASATRTHCLFSFKQPSRMRSSRRFTLSTTATAGPVVRLST